MPNKEKGARGKEAGAKSKSETPDTEVLRLIVDEVDGARETLELVNQLKHELPIRRFDDIRRAVGPKGLIRFRGVPYRIGLFEDLIPKIVYPIEDIEALVERVALVVQMVPGFITNDLGNPENVKRQRRRLFFQPPNGLPSTLRLSGSQLGAIGRVAGGPYRSVIHPGPEALSPETPTREER